MCLLVAVPACVDVYTRASFVPCSAFFSGFSSCFVEREPSEISGLRHVFIVTELACGGDLLAMLLSDKEVRAGASAYQHYSITGDHSS